VGGEEGDRGEWELGFVDVGRCVLFFR